MHPTDAPTDSTRTAASTASRSRHSPRAIACISGMSLSSARRSQRDRVGRQIEGRAVLVARHRERLRPVRPGPACRLIRTLERDQPDVWGARDVLEWRGERWLRLDRELRRNRAVAAFMRDVRPLRAIATALFGIA
jgi:hypothetical protein